MSNPILTIRSLAPSVKIKSDGEMERKNWMIRPTKRAIQDLLTFIDHVHRLVDDPVADKIGIVEWLDNVRSIFKKTITAIDGNHLQIGIATIEDNEELEMMEDLLENAWSICDRKVISIMDEESTSQGIDLLLSLIEFWVAEIKLRGWEIHGLLNGSVTCDEIKSTFSYIDKIDYPHKYYK